MQRAIILCPLYNDETSFNLFAAAVEKETANIPGFQFSFLVVNDGTDQLQLSSSLPITVVHLNRNLGHQKAIAIGLAYAQEKLSFERIIIMDCDGEDQPSDMKLLLHAEDGIVVARRGSRQEGTAFRFFYHIYKLLFYTLTGKQISFGNFMSVPKKEVARLVHHSEIWNHLAGALIKSKRPFRTVAAHRGKRFAGKSNMNFTALLLHGLGAIGVFTEIIAARLLVASFFMIVIAILAILVIVYVKYFTNEAIPGWATTTVSSLLIVILQSFLLSLFTIFLYNSTGGQRKLIPALHYKDYVAAVETNSNGA